jgi:periplasmic protein TonB
MATTRRRRTDPTHRAEPGPDARLSAYYLEESEDKKAIRWAFGIALLLHLTLLFVHLPEVAQAEPPPPEKEKVYVVQQVRFKPPPPEPTPELPQIRERIVPIPDPTPDEPEPIRPAQVIEPEIELPTDVIIEIPEGPPPVEPTGPVPVGGDVTAPVKVHTPKPQYTELARRARIQGLVIVQAVIDKRGQVVDAEVLRGLPMGLDQAAVDAVRRWRFEPATLNGKPVDVYYSLSVTFTLN